MRYIVVDTETTGFPEEGGKLVEIAAISRNSAGLLKEFQTYVNPGMPIPPVARAVHHISDADVAGAPSPGSAMEEMHIAMGAESGDVVWVAHNMSFDEKFLPLLDDSPKICTYRCALHIWPDAPGHGNQVLRYWLGLDESGELQLPEGLHPHRALYDILVTEGILRRMLRGLEAGTGGFDPMTQDEALLELVRLSRAPVVLTKARFGKHAGKAWDWIVRNDSSWCDWYLRLPDPDDDVRHTILHHRRMAQGRQGILR